MGNLEDKLEERTLDLREHLAAVRSILANERTFLSYQRTAVTEFVAAVTFIKFFDSSILMLVGCLLVPAAVLTGTLGMYRYHKMRRLLSGMDKEMCQKCSFPPPFRL